MTNRVIQLNGKPIYLTDSWVGKKIPEDPEEKDSLYSWIIDLEIKDNLKPTVKSLSLDIETRIGGILNAEYSGEDINEILDGLKINPENSNNLPVETLITEYKNVIGLSERPVSQEAIEKLQEFNKNPLGYLLNLGSMVEEGLYDEALLLAVPIRAILSDKRIHRIVNDGLSANERVRKELKANFNYLWSVYDKTFPGVSLIKVGLNYIYELK